MKELDISGCVALQASSLKEILDNCKSLVKICIGEKCENKSLEKYKGTYKGEAINDLRRVLEADVTVST